MRILQLTFQGEFIIVIKLNGKDYPLDKVLLFKMLCATAQIKSELLVVTVDTVITDKTDVPIVYAQDGKYLVLVTGEFTLKPEQTVKIMSKIVLKKISAAMLPQPVERPFQKENHHEYNQRTSPSNGRPNWSGNPDRRQGGNSYSDGRPVRQDSARGPYSRGR
jgi:hypothetical protein